VHGRRASSKCADGCGSRAQATWTPPPPTARSTRSSSRCERRCCAGLDHAAVQADATSKCFERACAAASGGAGASTRCQHSCASPLTACCCWAAEHQGAARQAAQVPGARPEGGLQEVRLDHRCVTLIAHLSLLCKIPSHLSLLCYCVLGSARLDSFSAVFSAVEILVQHC
jgi:hypothetical protein